MATYQVTFTLPAYPRGFHLITNIIENKLKDKIKVGIAHIFIHHTSAALSINENADPTVRGDFERFFSRLVPEDAPYFKHTMEGNDDMPAHIKSSLLGSSVMVPVSNGTLNLGLWQGIYLCEHRNKAEGRTITITLMGEHM